MSRSLVGVVCLLAVACSTPDQYTLVCEVPQAQTGFPGQNTGAPPNDTTGAPDVGPTGGSSGDGQCHILATYALNQSQILITNPMANFTITVQSPYSADLNTGPGWLTLRYVDAGGVPGDGPVEVVDYDMTWDFVTGVPGLASVHTELLNAAQPAAGTFVGTLSGDAITWASGSALDVCQQGQLTCDGLFCGSNGAPPGNQPTVVNDCQPWALEGFTVSADRTILDMEPALLGVEGDTTTRASFHGVLTASQVVCP